MVHISLFCADYINILGRSEYTPKKNTETLVVASKEIWLEINADKTGIWSWLEARMHDEVTI